MSVSYEEALFHEYFKWLLSREAIIQSDTEQLNGLELDLFFPERQAAFEIGDWALHSKTQDKDARKRRKAKRLGIHLVTLFTNRDHTTMPKTNGIPHVVAVCPRSSNIIWATAQIRWASTSKNRITRSQFLQIAKPVCKALDFRYKPVPQEKWPAMRDAAATACDTLKPKLQKNAELINTATASGTVKPQQKAITPIVESKPELQARAKENLPTDNQIIASIHGDWILIFTIIAHMAGTHKLEYARHLVINIFPTAIGYGQWPQPVASRLESLGLRALENITIDTSSTDAEWTTAIVGILQQAYRQCREHARTASLAMTTSASLYRLA